MGEYMLNAAVTLCVGWVIPSSQKRKEVWNRGRICMRGYWEDMGADIQMQTE